MTEPVAQRGFLHSLRAPRAPEALSRALLYFGLLACAGASVGLAAWELAARGDLVMFVLTNDPTKVALDRALPAAAGSALVFIAFGVLSLRFGLAALVTFARICSPLVLTALLPPLLCWRAWVGKPIVFLVLCAGTALGARVALESAFSAASQLRASSTAPPRVFAALARHAGRIAFGTVALGALGYIAYFTHHTLINHWNLGTNAYDLGIFDNLFWNALDRWDPNLPSSPFNGPDARHLTIHATLIVFVLAPLYAIWPGAETLLVIQSVGIGLAALPLYALARRRLGPWPSALVALAYLLYAPVHGPNLYEFHFMTLAPLLVWTSVWLLEAKRDVWAVLCLLLCLSVREDIAAGVAIVGAYLIATRQRPLAGLLIGALAVGYAGLMKLVVMPEPALMGATESFVDIYRGLLPGGKGSFPNVIGTVLTNPGYALGTLLNQDKILYALQIAVPLAFLPWLRPVGALCTLPGLFFSLLVTHAKPLIQISFHYTVHFTTYLFLALIISLEWLGDKANTPRAPHAQRAALGALVLAVVLTSNQFGAILQQGTAHAGYGQFVFGTSKKKAKELAALRRLVKRIPRDARVVASERVVPHISNRRYAYTLRVGAFDAEYLIAATREALPMDLKAVATHLESGAFGVVATESRFVLARRGHSTARNAAVVKRLRY